VVPKVWVETQTKVDNGQNMGHAQASQTGFVCFQRFVCFSVSVCARGSWEKGIP